MALNRENLLELAKVTANAKASSQVAYSFGEDKFSYSELNETLRNELKEIAGTYALYRENKNLVFALIEEVIDDVLTYAQGDKPVFSQRVTASSKRRAKQFITKVGLAGIYEVFKLDGKTYEIPTEAFGGAAQIGFEEFLDGRVDFADVLDVVMEGLDEAIYREIEKALKAAVENLGTYNKATETSFNETTMDRLIAVADSYGRSTIYCTYEFAATMVPAEGWASSEMKNQRWNNGYLANYKGHNVVVLNQSFEDETNSTKVIDPSYAYIIPVGADKPVKIAFEGNTIVDEYVNKDRSREVQVYKKLGVGTLITNNICVYVNSSLKTNMSI